MNTDQPRVPEVPLLYLDTLWFQVSGTLCNLTCTHCFVSCGPNVHRHEMISQETVRRYLKEAAMLGVREFYFTGGEPFLHKEMVDILRDTLEVGPATVLTNGTLFRRDLVARLAEVRDRAEYTLEIRISLDSFDEKQNDNVRGKGSFKRILRGIKQLAEAGFNPIITATQIWSDADDRRVRETFLDLLQSLGLKKPRLKVLPLFRLGREEERTHPYEKDERLTEEHMKDFDIATLQCSTGRMVTSQGVFVCPLLIDAPDAKLGETLAESLRPFPMAHGACHTCWLSGATCKNG
ncbi:MAG: radical SAM protein [Candidatus Tectomicrobia bacterium]|nr:radical SAM protein [Candidatus Tectomicrobia bacterium]